jgi:hypothetical protein
VRSILGEAQELLREKLMFVERLDVDLCKIRDTMAWKHDGASFLTEAENGLNFGFEWMLRMCKE